MCAVCAWYGILGNGNLANTYTQSSKLFFYCYCLVAVLGRGDGGGGDGGGITYSRGIPMHTLCTTMYELHIRRYCNIVKASHNQAVNKLPCVLCNGGIFGTKIFFASQSFMCGYACVCAHMLSGVLGRVLCMHEYLESFV